MHTPHLFRAKKHEEDIKLTNEIHNFDFTISLKVYGNGPLQLSTDKNSKMFPRLEKAGEAIKGSKAINAIFDDPAFSAFGDSNVLPIIYNEKKSSATS